MKTIRLSVAVLLLVAMVAILIPSAIADQFDKETRFTCSEPVRVGNAVLQPGTYWFKLEDLQNPRYVVVIRNEDRTKVVARVNAIANSRPKPDDHTAFDYWEVAAGKTQALRTWFYPGDKIGFEFPLIP